jgi:hypothetical protein
MKPGVEKPSYLSQSTHAQLTHDHAELIELLKVDDTIAHVKDIVASVSALTELNTIQELQSFIDIAKEAISSINRLPIKHLTPEQWEETFAALNSIVVAVQYLWEMRINKEDQQMYHYGINTTKISASYPWIKISDFTDQFFSHFKQSVQEGLGELQAKNIFDKDMYYLLYAKGWDVNHNPWGIMELKYWITLYPASKWKDKNASIATITIWDDTIYFSFDLLAQDFNNIVFHNANHEDDLQRLFEENKDIIKQKLEDAIHQDSWHNYVDNYYLFKDDENRILTYHSGMVSMYDNTWDNHPDDDFDDFDDDDDDDDFDDFDDDDDDYPPDNGGDDWDDDEFFMMN